MRQGIEINSIEKVTWREPTDTRDDRSVIHGTVLEPGHSVYDAYVGKPSPVQSVRNPVIYFDAPVDGNPCRCGCGGSVSSRDFLPGHDQTALHDRIKQIGTVSEFLDWFDVVRGHGKACQSLPTHATCKGS